MTNQELTILKEKIQKDMADLTQSIAHLEKATQPVGVEDMDEITRMNAVMNKSMNDVTLASARSRLLSLEYALKRIENSDFGQCLECGDPIPLPRLMAMPEAAFCIECAEDQ